MAEKSPKQISCHFEFSAVMARKIFSSSSSTRDARSWGRELLINYVFFHTYTNFTQKIQNNPIPSSKEVKWTKANQKIWSKCFRVRSHHLSCAVYKQIYYSIGMFFIIFFFFPTHNSK
jgi:predicted membrane protein